MKMVKSLLQRVVGIFLTAAIPRHIKRMLMLTTIYHLMKGESDLDLNDVEVLDKELSLSITHDPRSLMIPGKCDKLVWGDNVPSDLLHANQDTLMRDIVRNTPCWLLYARRDDILQEIQKVQNLALRQFSAKTA